VFRVSNFFIDFTSSALYKGAETDLIVFGRANSMDSFSREGGKVSALAPLNKEMAQLKESLLSGIDRLKSAIEKTEVLADSEIQQRDELRRGLEARIAALEGEARGREEFLRAKDSQIKELEDNLTVKIRDLEHQLREKDELLGARDRELKELNSEADALVDRMTQMESFIREQGTFAAAEARRVKKIKEGLEAGMAALEAEHLETDEALSLEDSGLPISPPGLITLREEDAITLEEAEQLAEREISTGLKEKEEEAKKLERMAEEIQRLKAEIQEKDLILAAREMEVKTIKQSMEEKVKELERIIKRQAGKEQRRSRLVPFFPPVDKRH